MKRIYGYLVLTAFALYMAGCSSTKPNIFQQMVQNVAQGNCDTMADVQTFVGNLPPDPFLNSDQKTQIQLAICHALFGPNVPPKQ